jgi:hypothetical protein
MSKRAGSTVVEAKGSHAIYVSQAKAVADLIEKAAKGVTAKEPSSQFASAFQESQESMNSEAILSLAIAKW